VNYKGDFMVIAKGEPIRADDINNLTFFPKGTILTFSLTAWNSTSSEFKNIWKICNTANHQADSAIPDLTNKFLRGGGASSGSIYNNPTTGNTQTITVPLPKHSHRHDHASHTGTFGNFSIWPNGGAHVSGVFSAGYVSQQGWSSNNSFESRAQVSMSAGHSFDETAAGTEDNPTVAVNTMPSYYTVIYIIKVV